MGKILGIDLGTTNSCMAVMEGGEPTIIPNAEGGRITPSVVYFSEEGEIVVGEMAKRQAILHPDRTVRSIKRKMGTRETIKIVDKEYSPEQISAMILEKLKNDASAYLGEEVKEAVITVPAYFEDPQRQATKDAGRIAGLEVKRIINEPTASCLAYGLDKEEELTVMVCDFGGGTFDVSILEIGEGVFEVKATSGNNKLGGDDFDERIMDYLIKRFKDETGIDLREDRSAMQRLKEASEKAKIELSNVTSTTISLPFIATDGKEAKHLEMTLTRAKFEDLIRDLVEKTVKPIKTAMKDANIKSEDIDKVLLVGGTTRVPLVQKRFKELLNKEPSKSINPDEAVALGAAIQAGILAGEVKDVLLLDVTPLTLGIETAGGLFAPVIPRNTTIPCKKTQIFTTSMDNQSTVEVHVLQGERPLAKDNRTLGKFHLIGIPPAPRGVPQIEVTFDIDANGIVHVSAKDLGTGREQRITITGTSTLSESEIQRMIKEAEEHRKEDLKRKKRIELINEAENLIYNTKHGIEDAKDRLDPEKVKEAKVIMKKLEKAIESKEYKKIKSLTDDLAIIANELFTELYSKVVSEREALAAPGSVEEVVAEEVVVEEDSEIESYKPEKLKCPKCGTIVVVETPIRPIDITCPNCGFTATLRTRRAKKSRKEVEKKVSAPEEKVKVEEGLTPPVEAKTVTETGPTESTGTIADEPKVKTEKEHKVEKSQKARAKRGAKTKKKGKRVTKEEGIEKSKERPKPKGKLKLKCPKCSTVIEIEKGDGPMEITCPSCGYTGTIKNKKKSV